MSGLRRVALVTGANKGLGLETARQLGSAPHGMTVLIGARDLAKGETAAAGLRSQGGGGSGGGVDAHAVRLDVTDGASIAAAVAEVTARWGRLDVLVNNAGVMLQSGTDKDGAPSTVSQWVLRETFETNFFGLVAVTQASLPLLKSAPAGRIVNLSSILGSMAEHKDPKSPIYNMLVCAYDASKAAVNMYTVELAHELRRTAIKVNAAHPGWVQTDMGGPQAPMQTPQGAQTAVWLATLEADGPSGSFFHMRDPVRW